MAVLKPRNRLVNFRLTEEELDALHRACTEQGARSISDFARGAVLRAMKNNGSMPQDPASPEFQQLNTKVATLESRVSQLVHLLESVESPADTSLVA